MHRLVTQLIVFFLLPLLMLGKRNRWIPSESQSAEKRLRTNIQDLWAGGATTTDRHATLLRDAYACGVDGCYSRVAEHHQRATPESLYREALSETKWPRPKVFEVPLVRSNGDIEESPLAFILPHELLVALFQQIQEENSGRDANRVLEEVSGLDETCAAHMQKLSSDWGVSPVPVSLWQDGVPFNWDRSGSLEIYSVSLPGLAPKKERGYRFPCTVVPHHMACKATHERVWEILGWSFAAMATGIFLLLAQVQPSTNTLWLDRPWDFALLCANLKVTGRSCLSW